MDDISNIQELRDTCSRLLSVCNDFLENESDYISARDSGFKQIIIEFANNSIVMSCGIRIVPNHVQLDLFKKLNITKYTINPYDECAIVDQDVNVSCQGDPYILCKLKIKEVTGDFNCSHNSLTSLQGAPSKVGGSFNCSHNSLTSLQGAPLFIVGNFYCSHNSLTSLRGAPQTVGGYFNCSHNSLESLGGAPSKVKGSFYCNNNSLTSLEGAPKTVGGDFYCHNNSKIFTEDKVQKVCKVFSK